MKRKVLTIIFLFLLLALNFQSATAQTYLFSVDRSDVKVYISSEGIVSIEYTIVFTNNPSADPIDFIDIGLPNDYYSLASISSEIDGVPIFDIEQSDYVDHGVALGLWENAIQPGKTGTVKVFIGTVNNILYPSTAEEAEDHASFKFSPNCFGKQYVTGNTDLTLSLYLPPGLTPNEPRFYPPENWPGSDEPESGIDQDGRIYYRWQSSEANSYTEYIFGAAFPAHLVPAAAIVEPPSALSSLDLDIEDLYCCGSALVFVLFIGFTLFQGIWGAKKRKLKYLPPKISIEGHGIKRGLTAIEASIVMEQPMDKILTMILFSTVKKNAATVIDRDPLKIDLTDPLPEGLRSYELEFLKAFEINKNTSRRRALQKMMVKLVKEVSKKMKGFSRKETISYYETIIRKAWHEVETADTPEIKADKFDEFMDWTMLDRKYDERTHETFRTGPIFVPIWWGRYDPTFRSTSISTSKGARGVSGSGRSISMPNLPGSTFAASVVNGASAFSAGVIGNLTSFTNGITSITNPVPKSSSSSFRSSGGSGCACACACAGCACACAGGGR